MKPKVDLKFNFSIARLKQLADNMLLLIDRDIIQFTDRGFTPAKRAAFIAQISLVDSIRSDEEMEGVRMTAIQLRNQSRNELEIAMRTVINMVQTKFADYSGKQLEFGLFDLSRQTDDELMRNARKMKRSSVKYLSELADEGLTNAKITQLETLENTFDAKIDQAIFAEKDRNTITEIRHIEANKLYDLLMNYADKGKAIWADASEAKYNDYIIYNNTTGSNPNPPDNSAE